MHNRSDRSLRGSRAVLTLGLAGVAVVAMAARSQTTQQPPAKPAPPMQMQMPMTPAPADSQKGAAATAVADSMAAAAAPMAAPMVMAAPPAPARKAGWPVDAAGRTLVNGTPVVGRVFTQQRVDGIVKYEYAKVYAGEPPHPAPAIVNARQNAQLPRNTRRFRGIMVEATLWSIDHKRSATELRTYRPSTAGSTLGQR